MNYIMVHTPDGLFEFAVDQESDPPVVILIRRYEHASAIPVEISRDQVPYEVWRTFLRRL